jgi:hypothetical protein
MRIEKPNYTQLPNVVLDNMKDFSDAELRVILIACRQTFGWQRIKAKMSISFLEIGTGMSRSGVIGAIKTLLENGLLERSVDGDGFSYQVTVQKDDFKPLDCSQMLVNSVDPPSQRRGLGVVNAVDWGVVNAVDTKKERILKKEVKKGEARVRALPPEAILWNKERGVLPAVLDCGSSRDRQLQARKREEFWVSNFESAVKKVKMSDFCTGKNDRGWKASFDWLLRPDTIAKVMEGRYDNRVKKTEFKYT